VVKNNFLISLNKTVHNRTSICLL